MYEVKRYCNPPSSIKRRDEDELTLLGANQQLILGKALKEAYNDEHGLLNQNWKSSNINVYSSFYPRTFQSGIAFLFGFLPQFKLADISVRPSPGIIFCMSEYYCQCPLARYLAQQERRLRYQFLLTDRKTVKTVQKLMGILQSYTEQYLFPDAFHMLDSLMLYACHKAPLPCIPGTNTCATFEDLHTLITHTIWVEKQLMANSTMKTYSIIKSQGLLMHLIDKIQNSIHGKDPTRFLLYSAHDLTLSPLLSVLGIHQNGVVPYASHMTFEIFSITEDSSAQYGLRIVYKGKDVTKQVSFCKPYFESSKTWRSALQRKFCPLESFFEFVVHLVPSTGHASYKALCNLHI
ncbi:hypothetical protein JTE90_028083 [Oedothorax gibbosus]|uniref:2-phosphoxylose phosphatase 1 n=1 Tax=Oedothorax gibbosus TaxID=931172 RepID=A0AAV6V8A1_9ARAC|nr:hypothetical protein JTE90_028083 [Oedothorax gibbosus]